MSPVEFSMLLLAICQVESGGNAAVINVVDGGSASYGLCQLKLSTARMTGFKGHVTSLLDRSTNLKYAGRYLRMQLDRYGGDVRKAVAAYNAGSVKGRIRNTKYVEKVMRRMGK